MNTLIIAILTFYIGYRLGKRVDNYDPEADYKRGDTFTRYGAKWKVLDSNETHLHVEII